MARAHWCWVPKATNTHSAYVTLTTFPLQQWFNERASMLGYSYNALPCCLYRLRDDVLRTAVVTKWAVRCMHPERRERSASPPKSLCVRTCSVYVCRPPNITKTPWFIYVYIATSSVRVHVITLASRERLWIKILSQIQSLGLMKQEKNPMAWDLKHASSEHETAELFTLLGRLFRYALKVIYTNAT